MLRDRPCMFPLHGRGEIEADYPRFPGNLPGPARARPVKKDGDKMCEALQGHPGK